MADKKRMTSRDLNIAVKRDDGIQYLLERFCFSGPEELFSAIEKVTPTNAGYFIRKLKKQKPVSQKPKTKEVVEAVESKVVVPEDSQTSTIEEAEAVAATETNAEAEENIPQIVDWEEKESTAGDKEPISQLEVLQLEAEKLRAQICDLECQHVDCTNERRDICERLKKSQNALNELKRLLEAQERNVTSLFEGYNECASKMDEINTAKRQKSSRLEAVRAKIEELRKISILVYGSGELEVDGAEEPEVLDNLITAELSRLISMDAADNLTIKELKTVAKLRLIVAIFAADQRKVELVFDSTAVQKFYETV